MHNGSNRPTIIVGWNDYTDASIVQQLFLLVFTAFRHDIYMKKRVLPE